MSIEPDFHLVKAIVDATIFFEFSDESVINPDVAIQAMEQMAAELQLMDEGARSAFCSQLKIVATSYSDDKADFISELPESLGLV